MRTREVVLYGGHGRLYLKYPTWCKDASAMFEVHDLGIKMQMSSDFQKTARIVKHPANCQAQFIEIETGRVARCARRQVGDYPGRQFIVTARS